MNKLIKKKNLPWRLMNEDLALPQVCVWYSCRPEDYAKEIRVEFAVTFHFKNSRRN